MDKLLNWSIAQQSGDKETIERIGQPDPEMLAQLFGAGPDEPTLMKQAMQVVSHPDATLEDKETAFDNFEMLIENLDNANNIENLRLWPVVISQLSSDIPESLRVYAASVVGIAVQNNPKSQEDFIKHEEGLKLLVSIAIEKSPKALLAKSLFALSSFIRNYADGYDAFAKLNGWDIVKNLFAGAGEDNKINLRVLSLISAILSTGLDDAKHQQIIEHSLIHKLVTILQKEDENISIIDKALNILSHLANLKYEFSESEVAELARGLDNIEKHTHLLSVDDYQTVKQVTK